MRHRLLALASACALAACSKPAPPIPSAEDGPPRVVTSSGALVGSADGDVSYFKGVPYAQPPIGDLRWAPPQPISWTGDRDATKFSLPCLQPTRADGQPNGAGVTGDSSEDCLYLNVWAPAGAARRLSCSGCMAAVERWEAAQVPTYDGTAFARDGVVLVTINYRLGSLGGFAHPALTKAADVSAGFGDYHLLDAIAALKWIRRNAAAFGGDPANVTVFGESAGATMTANLLTSPMAKGSFDRAIVEIDRLSAHASNAAGQGRSLWCGICQRTWPARRQRHAGTTPPDSGCRNIMADAKTRGGLRTFSTGM